MQEITYGLLVHAKFQVDRYTVASEGRKTRNLTKFSTLGAPIPTPVPIRAKSDMRQWTHDVLFFAKFLPNRCIVSPLISEKTQIQHFLVASSSGTYTKLNTGTQLQTFPYKTISKPFLNLNGLLTIPLAKTLLFKSMMNKKNIEFFFVLSGDAKSEPHHTLATAVEENSFCTSLTFLDSTYSFVDMRRKNFGKNAHPI